MAFTSTNIDDIVLLSVFFADPRIRPRAVVLGQFLGMGVLVSLSAIAGVAALAVPPGWTSLLGVVPLLLGLAKLAQVARARREGDDDDDEAEEATRATSKVHAPGSQIAAVAGVTVANGADNLGVYIPLFASDASRIALYTAAFAVMTGLWCALGYKLVNNRVVGERIARHGPLVLAIVLVLLGVHILAGARVLL